MKTGTRSFALDDRSDGAGQRARASLSRDGRITGITVDEKGRIVGFSRVVREFVASPSSELAETAVVTIGRCHD